MGAMEVPAEPDTHLAYYLVLVTDVLGQRSRLRDLRNLPQSEEEKKAAIGILQDTAAFVMLWRKGFKDYIREWGSPTPFVGQLPEDVRDSVTRAFSRDIAYRHFSDSVIVSVCLRDDAFEGCSVLLGVLGTLLAACSMHLLSLAAQRSTRGGVDVGLAMPLPEGDIYGPALERAVHLEAKIAGSPRIAAGQELVQYLAAVASQEAHTPHAALARNVAHLCRKLLFRDADGVLTLDFLGEELRLHGVAEIMAEALPKAYSFVRATQVHCHNQQDHKLARRYDMLWAYFQSRARVWGAEIERLANELDSK
jgi:hypothetical protein